jgi:hypothetical protein
VYYDILWISKKSGKGQEAHRAKMTLLPVRLLKLKGGDKCTDKKKSCFKFY